LIKEEDLESVENLVDNKDYQKHIINLTALNLMINNLLVKEINEASKKHKTEKPLANYEIIEISNQNFVEKILSNPRPVIIKAYADWCGPCKAIDGYYHEMNQSFGHHYQFASLNTDFNPELTTYFNIRGIPHFILIQNGQIVDQFSGANKTKLDDLIKKNLNQ
jgi:thioredoxin 1